MKNFRAMAILIMATSLAGCDARPRAVDLSAPLLQDGVKADQDFIADGAQHFAQEEYALAALSYQKAVVEDSRILEAWLGLAASYDQLRRFDLADRAYAQAAQLANGNVTVLNNRGYSYYLRGDLRQARKLFLEARSREPDNPAVLNNLRLVGALPSLALSGQ